MEIALKIDVDTHQGLGTGVPRLARFLKEAGVTANFYISMGPDNSGRAVIRAFRNRGFIRKMLRTRAVSMYGWRTILSGTLLPARPIALAYPEVIRSLVRDGFEVGVHGYDHVRWQDYLDRLGERGLRSELDDAFEAYRAITGERARAFAAPGWRTSATAMVMLDQMRLKYRSDTRGWSPYRCVVNGRALITPEIPTTLPTLDEILGSREVCDGRAAIAFYLGRFRDDQLNVHTIHAETEGMSQFEHFTALVRSLHDRGARFVQMDEIAARLEKTELPLCEVVRATIAGRAGWVSVQGPALTGGERDAD